MLPAVAGRPATDHSRPTNSRPCQLSELWFSAQAAAPAGAYIVGTAHTPTAWPRPALGLAECVSTFYGYLHYTPPGIWPMPFTARA